MTINTFLAILVAVLSFNGCELVAGPQGCEFGTAGFGCAPNPGNDGSSHNDSLSTDTSSKSDANSSPETEVDSGPTVEEICKDYMYLQDTKWVCHYGFDEEGILEVAMSDNHTCLVYSSSDWRVKAESLVFPTQDQLVYDSDKYGVPPSQGFGPKICDKVK